MASRTQFKCEGLVSCLCPGRPSPCSMYPPISGCPGPAHGAPRANQKAAGEGLGHPVPAVGPVSGRTRDLPQLSLRLGDARSGPGTLQLLETSAPSRGSHCCWPRVSLQRSPPPWFFSTLYKPPLHPCLWNHLDGVRCRRDPDGHSQHCSCTTRENWKLRKPRTSPPTSPCPLW